MILEKHPFLDKVLRNSAALVFAISFIAVLKVTFGGDWSLVTPKTVLNALLIVVPLSVIVAIAVTAWEWRNKEQNEKS